MGALYRLSASSLRNPQPGKHCDGGGLWLIVRPDGGAQWTLRYTIHGRRREMGLGRLVDVSLKEARIEADRWRAVVRLDLDPLKEREKAKREAAKVRPTLRTIAHDAFESRKASLKGDGKAGRWFSPIELHILPRIGAVPIEDIDQRDIRDTLAPIWHEKGETARKAANRLSIVMRHAAALGLSVDIQAVDKARALLGVTRQKTKHIPAMPWVEVPAFWPVLSEGGMVEQALKFLILTMCRTSEVRGAKWSEIEGDIWFVPKERMKPNSKKRIKEGDVHRVPLTAAALQVLETLKPLERDGFIFPSVRRGHLSDMAMSSWMKRKGYEYRPHGFRSSFRDWCADATNAPHEVAEACLAHVTGSAVVRAYRRTDFLEQRRILMERWSCHVEGRLGEVVTLHG